MVSDTTSAFEGWAHTLNSVVDGNTLTASQSSLVMSEILEGRATSAQLAALLAVLRSRGETVEEMTGFAGALRSAAVALPLSEDHRARAIDTCGTGGDRSNTINVSTTSAFVVAAGGVPVCKHGNRASSSKSGTADVLEALGVNIDPGPDSVARCIETVGIGFCLAPAYHPAMRFPMPTRRELGIPTAFNFLGPLVNPGLVKRQVVGVSDPKAAELMLKVLVENGSTRAMVVYGNDGLDEITSTTTSVIHDLRDGEVRRYEIDPADFGIAYSDHADLVGGDPAFNAERVRRVLEGETHPQGDLVVLNAAAGLIVGDKADNFKDAIEHAQSLVSAGKGIEVLDAFITASNA